MALINLTTTGNGSFAMPSMLAAEMYRGTGERTGTGPEFSRSVGGDVTLDRRRRTAWVGAVVICDEGIYIPYTGIIYLLC